MNILTSEEKNAMSFKYGITTTIIGIIEAATVKRLAGVSVEPATWGEISKLSLSEPLYTATAIAAARVQALQDVIGVLDEYDSADSSMGKDIRALLGKEVQS